MDGIVLLSLLMVVCHGSCSDIKPGITATSWICWNLILSQLNEQNEWPVFKLILTYAESLCFESLVIHLFLFHLLLNKSIFPAPNNYLLSPERSRYSHILTENTRLRVMFVWLDFNSLLEQSVYPDTFKVTRNPPNFEVIFFLIVSCKLHVILDLLFISLSF